MQQLWKQIRGSVRSDEQIKKYMIQMEMLNNRIGELEKQLHMYREDHCPIFIENINVEQLYVDKVEYETNIGSLGIRTLEGRLNIGATYGGEWSGNTDKPDAFLKKNGVPARPGRPDPVKVERTDPASGPKCVIKPKAI